MQAIRGWDNCGTSLRVNPKPEREKMSTSEIGSVI